MLGISSIPHTNGKVNDLESVYGLGIFTVGANTFKLTAHG